MFAGEINLNSPAGTVKEGHSVVLTCSYDGGNNVEFWLDGIKVGTCFQTFGQCLNSSEAGFTTSYNDTLNQFYLTVFRFNISFCGTYECRDAGTAENSTQQIAYSGILFHSVHCVIELYL